MAIEIERKFLLRNDDWRAVVQRSEAMAQAYFNAAEPAGGERTSIRVRIAETGAWLNIKSRDLGPMRLEFEYPIPEGDARALFGLCVGAPVEKRRHYVNYGGHVWEIDEFAGTNAGLVVAEVEFESVDQSFDAPPWLGREVTELPRYYNLALAARPFSQWSDDERRAADA